MKKCPHCAEEIQDEAKVCRYCGREMEPAPTRRQLLINADAASRIRSIQTAINIILVLFWALYNAVTAALETFIICSSSIFFLYIVITIIFYVIFLQQWDGHSPKPRFPWWTVIVPSLLCLTPIAIGLLMNDFPAVTPATPTIRPTFTYAAPTSLLNRTATATINPCTPAFFVFSSHEGKTICVYGDLVRQQFIPHNRTVRLYLSESPPFFFLCENCYYDVEPGDCLTARGRIELTTDDQPFINLHQQDISFCQ